MMVAHLENFNENEDFRVGQVDYMTWRNGLGYLLDKGRTRQGCMVPDSQFNLVLLPLPGYCQQHKQR